MYFLFPLYLSSAVIKEIFLTFFLLIQLLKKTKQAPVKKRDPFKDDIKFAMLNCRSLGKKSNAREFQRFVTNHGLDIVCVCETRLSVDTDTADLRPDGYCFKHCPRVSGRGGGVGFLYRDDLHLDFHPPVRFDSFEYMSGKISNSSAHLHIIIIYRPPGKSVCTFLDDEFPSLLDKRIYKRSPLVITGDLNIHLEDTQSSPTRKFNKLINDHALSQLVRDPTHDKGGTLDALIVRTADNRLISNLQVVLGISDHDALLCKLRLSNL